MKLLENITVLELTTYWAATSTGRFLHNMGARVIRVETPPRGDACRYFGAVYRMPTKAEENPIHDMYNGGKETVALDLTKPEDMEVFMKIMAKADIFLTSTREKGLKKLGLDYPTLKKKFPGIIMAHATGWGNDGPMSGMPGIDGICFFGKNGLLTDLRMDPDSPPTYSPTGMGDLTTGIMLTAGTLAALYKKERTGEGDYVMASLYGTGNWVTSPMTTGTQYGYEWPRNTWNSSPMGQAYRCKDGKFIFSFVNEYDKVWPHYAKALGIPDEIANDPRYNNRMATLDPTNRKNLVKICMDYAAERNSDEIEAVFKECDIPGCVLSGFKEKYEGKELEQAVLNGYLAKHTYASGKEVYLSQMPLYFDSEGVQDFYEPHRAIGENNEEIIKEFCGED